MEIWDIYDRDRALVHKTMRRGDAFEHGAYHLVVHICIFNAAGDLLIQQRQPFKSGWSGMWDVTVGGSAVSGETSCSAAEREAFEELGYKIDLANIRPSLTVNFENGFDDFYLVEGDMDTSGLKLQYKEVQQVRWTSKSDIFSMIDSQVFIPYHKSLIELLFDMRKQMGAHQSEDRLNLERIQKQLDHITKNEPY
nr:NUDIX domain-containing protein [Sporolactobacillus pectinivorans]